MDERERPVEVERHTTVIQTDRGGGGGVVVAIIVLFILGALAFFYFGGYFEKAADEVDVNVNVEAPKVELPEVDLNVPPAQPGNSG